MDAEIYSGKRSEGVTDLMSGKDVYGRIILNVTYLAHLKACRRSM